MNINIDIYDDNKISLRIYFYDEQTTKSNRYISINDITRYKYPKVFEYLTDIINERTKNSLNLFIDNNPGLKREMNINKL